MASNHTRVEGGPIRPLQGRRQPFGGSRHFSGSSQRDFVFGPLSLPSTLPARPPKVHLLGEKEISAIEGFARESTSGNNQFHDFAHTQNTARLALFLAEKNAAGPEDAVLLSEVCWAAAMLRDVMRSTGGRHQAKSARKARKFLQELRLAGEFVQRVEAAILASHKVYMPKNPSKEEQVLWESRNMNNMGFYGLESRLIPLFVSRVSEKHRGGTDGVGPKPVQIYVQDEGRRRAARRYLKLVGQFRTPLLKEAIASSDESVRMELERMLSQTPACELD